MSVRISEIGDASLERAIKLLAGVSGGIWRATYSALRRAGSSAKTKAGQYAAEEYTINKGDFMRNVKEKSYIKNEAGTVSMNILYAGNVLPLMVFDTKFSRTGKLQTRVKRSGVATLLNRAFAAKPYGPVGVFERVGDERFPIEQKFGPSTAHMLENENVIKKIDETIKETFDRRMDHEINRVLNGWGGK